MKVRSDVPFQEATPEEQTYMEWLRKLGVRFEWCSPDDHTDTWYEIEPGDLYSLGYDPGLRYRMKRTDDP